MQNKNYDVLVVGGGHAGVEAALAAARLGKITGLVNLYEDRIATMPCNPSIGGPAKGIVVREIDALGGEMAKATDATALQTKLLNSSRGPGVWALRTQSDKIKYSEYMRQQIINQANLDLIIKAADSVVVDELRTVQGLKFDDGSIIKAKTVILTTGTYLKSEILQGVERLESGPNYEPTTKGISQSLRDLGIDLLRFKTGTPARVYQDSVDLSQAQEEPGTDAPLAFSFSTKTFTPIEKQALCYLIHTTNKTKQIIIDNLEKSAVYSGTVDSIGPRYCPSFEDKIVRFGTKETHQIFIEPESDSLDT